MYLSARLSAREDKALDSRLLTQITEARDASEAERRIREMFNADAKVPLEEIFTAALRDAFAFAEELIGGTPELFVKPYEVLLPFKYVYDAQNLKAAVKCDALGDVSKAKSMFTDCGTVPLREVTDAVTARDFTSFPDAMKAAALTAVDELAASHDPQCVDRLLDKAVFADMTAAAKETGIPYVMSLIAARADCVNIKTALRCLKRNIGKAHIVSLLVDGGTLEPLFFDSNGTSVGSLLAALAHTDYASLSHETGMADIERLAENVYLAKAARAKHVAFGIERVIGYIVEAENGVRNLRVAYAGKKAGKTTEEIRHVCFGL